MRVSLQQPLLYLSPTFQFFADIEESSAPNISTPMTISHPKLSVKSVLRFFNLCPEFVWASIMHIGLQFMHSVCGINRCKPGEQPLSVQVPTEVNLTDWPLTYALAIRLWWGQPGQG